MNAKVMRGMYGGSDHFMVVAKLRMEKWNLEDWEGGKEKERTSK